MSSQKSLQAVLAMNSEAIIDLREQLLAARVEGENFFEKLGDGDVETPTAVTGVDGDDLVIRWNTAYIEHLQNNREDPYAITSRRHMAAYIGEHILERMIDLLDEIVDQANEAGEDWLIRWDAFIDGDERDEEGEDGK